jgi:hypothetical protein
MAMTISVVTTCPTQFLVILGQCDLMAAQEHFQLQRENAGKCIIDVKLNKYSLPKIRPNSGVLETRNLLNSHPASRQQ